MVIEEFVLEKYKRLLLSNIQRIAIYPKSHMQLIIGSNGAGKAQPLDSWVKVPGGWKPMGEMKIGTEVIAKDGTTTKVNGVFPQGKKQIYKITFADGRTARATGDHLWSVYHGGSVYPIVPRVITTEDIIHKLSTARGHLLWVDLIDAEGGEDKELPVDPYVMGVILGDGCIDGSIVITNPEEFIFEKVSKRLRKGLELKVRNVVPDKCLTYSIVTNEDTELRGHNNIRVNHHMVALREYGLGYKRSWDKSIPKDYLLASRRQRLELLQGLMDTDGYIGKGSTSSYCTVSHTLAEHVAYLVRSLGGLAKISQKRTKFTNSKGERVPGRLAYNVNIRYKKPSELFTLPKKKERANDNGQYNQILKLRIKSIEPDGIEEAQCISIDHPDSLYVTDNFVVTHNSSILEELTPLPTNHRQFAKGGSKSIVLTHRGRRYKLYSEYNSGTGHHTFEIDGEVLNNKGTMAVQKELVEEHFGLTREIHELLIGITKFTDMTTAKRREWLTKLSPVDLKYAFDVYNKSRSLHRDQQGVIKHINKRMARENQDLPDDSEVAQLRKRVGVLTDKLDSLFTLRQPNVTAPFSSSHDFQQRLQRLTRQAQRLLSQQITLPPEWGVGTLTGLSEAIETVSTQYQRQQAVLEKLQEDHQQLIQQAPSRDVVLSEEEIATLRGTVQSFEQKQEQLGKRIAGYHGMFPLVELPADRNPHELLQSVFNDWQTLLQTFPENAEGYYSSAKGIEVKDRVEAFQAQRQKLDAELTSLLSRLSRMKGCETIQCPNCQHHFQPGVDPKEITQLEMRKTETQNRIDVVDKQLKEDREYLEAYDDYLGYVRQFRRLVNDSPMFQPVWDVCIESQVMTRQPRRHANAAIAWFDAMQLTLERQDLCQERDVLKHRLRYVEAIDRHAMTQQDARRKELEDQIDSLTNEVRGLHRRHQEMRSFQEQVMTLREDLSRVATDIEGFLGDTETQRDALFQKAIGEETQQTQMQLAQTQEQLSRIELREGVLKDLELQHEQSKQAQTDYHILVKSLSPTDGLIGRYLMGFMQGVVKMINAVIAEIWTYPMEVLPSQVEKDELNYKFPLDVNNGAVMPEDISRGSASQRDIINFAFKLLVMKFLKLEEMPLYLDEFGSTFDEQHRLNLIPFINQMLEMNQIRQLFFISHFSATHGAFNQADVCVIDPSNITVPQRYNEHVEIS